MSDYLSNLAARSSLIGEKNINSLLQPRLPSLFESSGRAGEYSEASSLEQIEETIMPSRTIFGAPDNQKFVKASQQVDTGLNFASHGHLDALVPEMTAVTVATQKHREFVPSYPKLNPLPVGSRSHSLSPRMAQSEKQEPTIQVHIGRIEVRAVTASHPTSAQKPSAPNLTLEQYLRQRNEGKR